MAAKQTEKSGSVPVGFPSKGFAKSMVFNRFYFEEDPNFLIIHFAYVNRVNFLVDQFACAMMKHDLENAKESNLEYLGRIGSIQAVEPVPWQPPSVQQEIVLVNQMSLCRMGTVGEITFHNFPIKAILDSSKIKTPEKLTATPVAILRSNAELHKHFVRLLYTPQ